MLIIPQRLYSFLLWATVTWNMARPSAAVAASHHASCGFSSFLLVLFFLSFFRGGFSGSFASPPTTHIITTAGRAEQGSSKTHTRVVAIAGLGWLGWLLHCKSKTQREHLMLTTPLFLRLERAWHLSNMRAVNKHTHTRERVARRVEKRKKKSEQKGSYYMLLRSCLHADLLCNPHLGWNVWKFNFQSSNRPAKKPMHIDDSISYLRSIILPNTYINVERDIITLYN